MRPFLFCCAPRIVSSSVVFGTAAGSARRPRPAALQPRQLRAGLLRDAIAVIAGPENKGISADTPAEHIITAAPFKGV